MINSSFLTQQGNLHYSVKSPSLLWFWVYAHLAEKKKQQQKRILITDTELSNSSNEDHRLVLAYTRVCSKVVAPAGNMGEL